MANIAIINYCNLKCPYCFADDMIHEKSKCITLDDFRKILEFTARTPDNHIGLIGGEPTLHPDFENILKEVNRYCKECNTGCTLFTNGINLEKFLPFIGERIGTLLNLNSPKFMSKEFWTKTNEVLDHLDSLSWLDDGIPGKPAKVNIGCNVHPGLDDYSFLWEIVDKYKLHHIRTSVVSPGGQYTSMRNDKNAYFAKMKPIFIEHCKNAEKHKVILNIDCGHIPSCYFTVEELDLVRKVCDGHQGDFCEPVIDITSDFKATACFGTWDPVDIRDFKDIHELRRYLMATRNIPRSLANCDGKCAICKKHELMQCQGGCLGFADPEKLKKIQEVFNQ